MAKMINYTTTTIIKTAYHGNCFLSEVLFVGYWVLLELVLVVTVVVVVVAVVVVVVVLVGKGVEGLMQKFNIFSESVYSHKTAIDCISSDTDHIVVSPLYDTQPLGLYGSVTCGRRFIVKLVYMPLTAVPFLQYSVKNYTAPSDVQPYPIQYQPRDFSGITAAPMYN